LEGIKTIKDLTFLKDPKNTSISVITPPKVTTSIVKQAIGLGIRNIWLQPGSESQEALDFAKAAGIDIIANGPCVLVSGPASMAQAYQAKH
jgi:predicted CoA-binding protein